MTSGPAKTRDVVVAELEAEIFSGHLAPGDRLLSERQLAEVHGVSRPIVREALRTLAERGLLEIAPARGAFVRSPSALVGVRPLEVLYRRGRATAREVSEARLMIECEAAALAAQRGDLQDIRELEQRLDALEDAHGATETVAADLAFHLRVARASHNRIVEAMLASLATLAAKLMVRSLEDQAVYAGSAPFHRKVFEAVAARDPDRARSAMAEHLGVASGAYGREYDHDLDTMAQRALRRLGSTESLDDFLRGVLPSDRTQPAGKPAPS